MSHNHTKKRIDKSPLGTTLELANWLEQKNASEKVKILKYGAKQVFEPPKRGFERGALRGTPRADAVVQSTPRPSGPSRLLKHETRTIHVKTGEHLVYENDKARAPRRPRRAPATRTRDAHPRHTRPGPCSHAPWATCSVLTSVLPRSCSCRCDLWTRTQGGASRLWRSRRGQPPPTG